MAAVEIFPASHLLYCGPSASQVISSPWPSKARCVTSTCAIVVRTLLPANRAVTSCQKTRRCVSVGNRSVASDKKVDKTLLLARMVDRMETASSRRGFSLLEPMAERFLICMSSAPRPATLFRQASSVFLHCASCLCRLMFRKCSHWSGMVTVTRMLMIWEALGLGMRTLKSCFPSMPYWRYCNTAAKSSLPGWLFKISRASSGKEAGPPSARYNFSRKAVES